MLSDMKWVCPALLACETKVAIVSKTTDDKFELPIHVFSSDADTLLTSASEKMIIHTLWVSPISLSICTLQVEDWTKLSGFQLHNLQAFSSVGSAYQYVYRVFFVLAILTMGSIISLSGKFLSSAGRPYWSLDRLLEMVPSSTSTSGSSKIN